MVTGGRTWLIKFYPQKGKKKEQKMGCEYLFLKPTPTDTLSVMSKY